MCGVTAWFLCVCCRLTVWCYSAVLVCVLQVDCVEREHEQFRRYLRKDAAASKRLVSF